MKKRFSIILMSIFLLSLSFVQNVNAKEEVAPRSIETLTATGTVRLNKGGSDRGYVDCFATIDYNIQAKTYKVSAVYIKPHISWTSPFLSVGGVTSKPAVGSYISKGQIVVISFNAREGTSGAMWSYDCNVYF